MTHRMSTHELLEMASLDALGLLTDEERAAFEAGFQTAPPALQAQLRAEQARMAGDDSLLPPVTPPVGLRARVLAAVREAIGASRTVAGRIAPDILPGRGVTPIWRAAAIGCLAASIVFGFTTLHMMRTFETVAEQGAATAYHEQLIRDFGPRVKKSLLDPNLQKVAFTVSAGDEAPRGASAAVFLDARTGTGEFYCANLPDTDGEYQLVLMDQDGNIAEAVLKFTSSGPFMPKTIQRKPEYAHLQMALIEVERSTGDSRTLLRAAQAL